MKRSFACHVSLTSTWCALLDMFATVGQTGQLAYHNSGFDMCHWCYEVQLRLDPLLPKHPSNFWGTSSGERTCVAVALGWEEPRTASNRSRIPLAQAGARLDHCVRLTAACVRLTAAYTAHPTLCQCMSGTCALAGTCSAADCTAPVVTDLCH